MAEYRCPHCESTAFTAVLATEHLFDAELLTVAQPPLKWDRAVFEVSVWRCVGCGQTLDRVDCALGALAGT